jgi:uncharacterized RDD family membrane protein YckC
MRWRDTKKRRVKKIFSKAENSSKVVYATFLARFFAIAMDTFLILAPITILTGIIFGYDALKNPEANQVAGNFQMVLALIVTVALWKISGQTPGKKAFNVIVVDGKTFQRASLFKLVVRYLSYFLSMITIIGFFLPLLRKDRKALHDLISGTAVIERQFD